MKQNKQNKVLFFQKTTPKLNINALKLEANISMSKKVQTFYRKFPRIICHNMH